MNDSRVVVYKASNLITMTGETANAMAVSGNRIIAVGGVQALEDRFPEAQEQDFGRHVIAPGFNDAHMHLMQAADDAMSLDLSRPPVHSISDIKARVSATAEESPVGVWVRGFGYDDGKISDSRTLSRDDLDQAAPNRPVLVRHVAGHWGVANSAALAAGRITDGTADPEGGRYGRDAAGRLNGVMYEQAFFDFAIPQLTHTGRTVLPQESEEDRRTGLQRAARMLHSAGLTSVSDAIVDQRDVQLLSRLAGHGELGIRVNVLVTAEHYDSLRELKALPGVGQEWVRIGGVKTFVDGAIGGRTCLLDDPLPEAIGHGIQSRSVPQLRETIRRAQHDGVTVGVHANGDRAIGLLLDIFEDAMQQYPRPGLHHRIEHGTVLTENLVRRIKRVGAAVLPFGSYVAYHGGNLVDWYGPDRVERMFAHRWLIDAGVNAAGSSDFPCGPYEPLLALQSMVTRRGLDGASVGESQRISVQDALRCYTVKSADLSGESGRKGRLAPGYLADFIVLDQDPTAVDSRQLASIQVLETFVGGRQVWSAVDDF